MLEAMKLIRNSYPSRFLMANPASEGRLGESYDMESAILDAVGYGIHILVVLVGNYIFKIGHLRHQIWSGDINLVNLKSAEALYNGGNGLVGHLDDFNDFAQVPTSNRSAGWGSSTFASI